MTRARLEAFSDGVFAIILTIMVLELRPPHGTSLADLMTLSPKFWSYVMSFVYLAIYWNNHHHLMHSVREINGRVLWANTHLLFWLSLVPFTTAWLGEQHLAQIPVVTYGVVLLLSAVAYFILSRTLLSIHTADSELAKGLGRDWKGKMSVVAYLLALPLAFVSSWLALAIYAGTAVAWWVPDRRLERERKP